MSIACVVCTAGYALLAIYILNLLFSPLMFWRGYFTVWKLVLFRSHPKGRITMANRIRMIKKLVIHFLKNPLWSAMWYLDEILYGSTVAKEVISKPLFMFNQPRNGSTYFHRTLADNPCMFAVKHIEWRYPFVFVQKLINKYKFIHDYVYEDYWGNDNSEAAKKARAMHNQTMDDYEEDGCFFEEHVYYHAFNALWNPFPELLTYMCRFHDIDEKTRMQIMTQHQHVVKKVQLLRRAARKPEHKNLPLYFVSKENESWHRLPEYFRLYPDAKYLCICRPTKNSILSFANLLVASCGHKSGTDLNGEVNEKDGFIISFFNQKRVDCKIQIDLFENKYPDSPMLSLDLMMANMLASVSHVLEKLNIPMTPDYRDYLLRRQAEQDKRKTGDYESQDDAICRGDGFDEFNAFHDRVLANHKKILEKFAKSNSANAAR